MKKYTPLVVLVLITIFGVWALWMKTRPTDDSFAQQAEEPGIEELVTEDIGSGSEPEPEQTQSTTTQPSGDGSTGKRIVHVPDNRQDSELSNRDIDQEFRQSVNAKIETALDGNIEDMFTVIEYMRECDHVSLDELSLTIFLTANANRPGSQFRIPDGIGDFTKTASFDEWEAYHWQRFNHCQPIKGLFEDDFRSRLKTLAVNRHVIARYIYALWPPRDIKSSSGVMAEILEYESLALEFTWLNIDEGEPLGLLALGQSYLDQGIFTPYRPYIGLAYIIAANKCGISSTQAESTIDNSIFLTEKSQEDSDEIVETFCN